MAEIMAPAIILNGRHFKFILPLKPAIVQYGCRRGIFKFVVTYVRHVSYMAASAVIFKFFLD